MIYLTQEDNSPVVWLIEVPVSQGYTVVVLCLQSSLVLYDPLLCIKQVDKLRHAYPPFVNYFEKTKEKLAACTKSNHRFYAFMKVCQRRPECGRQLLPDLMMNIVQRLPRIELLLQRE